MTHFAVFDEEGRILRTGTCPKSMLSDQAGDGEFVMECGPDVRDDTHEVKNHRIVKK